MMHAWIRKLVTSFLKVRIGFFMASDSDMIPCGQVITEDSAWRSTVTSEFNSKRK